jgi:capsule polysaccharide export protein KpsC/LpsZ
MKNKLFFNQNQNKNKKRRTRGRETKKKDHKDKNDTLLIAFRRWKEDVCLPLFKLQQKPVVIITSY